MVGVHVSEFNEDVSCVVSFPLWFLVHPNLKANGFITLTGRDSEKCMPFFSDSAVAKRFQSGNPELSHYVSANAHLDQFPGVLNMLEAEGYTHITIDHTRDGAMFVTIAEVRAYLAATSD